MMEAYVFPMLVTSPPSFALFYPPSYAIADVATLNDLDGVGAELDGKANISDLKLLAQQQAALAQSVNGMAEWLAVRPETSDGSKGTGSSATKFKCLTCDREIKSQGGSNGRYYGPPGIQVHPLTSRFNF